MKEIWGLFKRDLKKIARSRMAVIILIGMAIIPGIYAWLNIDSNWDPYDNTGNIPIAIVNHDQGVNIFKENVNIGNSLTDTLKTNSAMKWIITEEQDARDKVESGEYYGAIILPSDFSSKITTLFDGTEIKKPTFDFIVNDKKNPIAPIITNKAVDTLETTLDQAFVEAIALKTFEKAEDSNLSDNAETTITNVLTKIKETKDGIGNIRSTLRVISSATSSTASALSAVKSLLPSTVDSLKNTAVGDLSAVQRSAANLNNLNSQIDENIGQIFLAATKLSGAIETSVNSIDPNSPAYQLQVRQSIALVDSLNTVLQEEQKVVTSLQGIVDSSDLTTLQTQISTAIQQDNELKVMLQSAADGNISMLDQAKPKAHDLNSTVNNINSTYQNSSKPTVESAIKKANSAVSETIGSVAFLNSAFTKSDTALGETINALNSVSTMNANIDVLLANLEKDLDKVAASISGATESDLYLKILNLLQNSPEAIADFISEPITTKKTELYKIEHYGSKMAPFYTILATWVGCTLLVAVLKTDIEADEQKIKPHQAFFGRFLLFGTIAMCQGLVIGLGDIVLGVQVLNIPLFLFAVMLSSFIYMLIIYSLAISFGKVGEAIAVVLMVMQVAGSGGTFPIELLPDFFQKLQPFMPFYPSMSAVRETIGGFYGATYLSFILLLLCHTIIPLILGLVIRRPIIKMKKSITKDVENTDVII